MSKQGKTYTRSSWSWRFYMASIEQRLLHPYLTIANCKGKSSLLSHVPRCKLAYAKANTSQKGGSRKSWPGEIDGARQVEFVQLSHLSIPKPGVLLLPLIDLFAAIRITG